MKCMLYVFGENEEGTSRLPEWRIAMEKEKKEFLVEGFLFQEEELAEKAKKEAAGIQYIRNKISMKEPKMVLQMYNKMIEQKMFETQVGICYLKELQEYLKENPAVHKEEIKQIPIEKISRSEPVTIKKQEEKKKENEKMRGSVVLNVVLVFMVIAMFAITLTSDHPNILNYEEKLLNKYSEWEQELKEREKQVREKENELGLE